MTPRVPLRPGQLAWLAEIGLDTHWLAERPAPAPAGTGAVGADAVDADAVYLPGGYPELHGPALAKAGRFRQGMGEAAGRGARIYGECGGYMTLGEALVAADGSRYEMLGLLPLVTSFAERRRHLGYRCVTPLLGSGFSGAMTAHEFHYSTILTQPDAPLAAVTDATGATVPETGSYRLQSGGGLSTGTFFHLIAGAP